jgi:hypothetical protein
VDTRTLRFKEVETMPKPLPLFTWKQKQSGNSFHAHRGLRVAVLLCGIVLCLDILHEPIPVTGYQTTTQAFDPILLHSSDRIQVHQEIPLSHQSMFSNPEFGRLTGNMHVWAYMQTVEAGGLWGSLTYFKFRTGEEARSAYERLKATPTTPRERELSIVTRYYLYEYYLVVVRTLDEWGEGKRLFVPVSGALGIRAEMAARASL